MSKVYVCVKSARDRSTKAFEVTASEAKVLFTRIKAVTPRASVSVFGARDIETLRRSQPSLGSIRLIQNTEEFIHKLPSLV